MFVEVNEEVDQISAHKKIHCCTQKSVTLHNYIDVLLYCSWSFTRVSTYQILFQLIGINIIGIDNNNWLNAQLYHARLPKCVKLHVSYM